MGLPIMGGGGIADMAVGVGVGVAALAGANIPGMLRCMDLDALGLVYFDFNPSEITVRRKSPTQNSSSMSASSSRPTPLVAQPPTISMKLLLIGWDTKMRADTLLAWAAPPRGLITAIVGALGGAPGRRHRLDKAPRRHLPVGPADGRLHVHGEHHVGRREVQPLRLDGH